MQAAEARPPYVTFEVRAEEDRTASIEAGHYVAKDVTYAMITPQGSKDRIERQVDDWFANLKQQVAEGRFPQEWLTHFQASYKAWQEGREIPLTGHAIVNWPAVSPAQVKQLQQAHILTVEDLAGANEETVGRLGMGARALKQRAIEWLAVAKDTGKIAEEVAALKATNADLAKRNDDLQTKLETMAKQIEALGQGGGKKL